MPHNLTAYAHAVSGGMKNSSDPFTATSLTVCGSFALCLLIGCGQRDESLAEVRGDVTFCGQPATAEVLFEPLSVSGQSSGRASTATTAADGSFRMMLDDSQPGAKIGRHRVTIRVQELSHPDGRRAASGTTAEKMIAAIKTTQLAREVWSGSNQFHFRLTF